MINKIFSSILWEYDLEKLNYDDEIVFIRSLNFWDKNHIDTLKEYLWIEKFKNKFINNIQNFDKKTINYWCIIFWIDKSVFNNINDTYDKLNSPIFTRNFGW